MHGHKQIEISIIIYTLCSRVRWKQHVISILSTKYNVKPYILSELMSWTKITYYEIISTKKFSRYNTLSRNWWYICSARVYRYFRILLQGWEELKFSRVWTFFLLELFAELFELIKPSNSNSDTVMKS